MDNEYGYVGLCPDDIGVPATAVRAVSVIDVNELHRSSHGEHVPGGAA